MTTKPLLVMTVFFLFTSTIAFANSFDHKKQSVESSLTGDNRWKNNNKQSTESILQERIYQEEILYKKKVIQRNKSTKQSIPKIVPLPKLSKVNAKQVACSSVAKDIFLKSTKATAKNAISICELELNSNPDDPDLQYYYATTLFELKRISKAELAPKAEKWFRKAANNGSIQAASMLGIMYRKEWMVKRNNVEAAKWYEVAAERGEVVSQSKLGELYLAGIGVKTNNTKARYWFQKAAEQGDDAAQSYLGVMYLEGAGGNKDFKQAFKWSSLAAEKNNSEGQYNVGRMYLLGKGVQNDNEKAMSFFKLAAKQNHLQAQQMLDTMNGKRK